MIESLPDDKQEKVTEHLREYLDDLIDEIRWDSLFKGSQSELAAAAKKVKKEIIEGRAENFDYKKL